MCLKLEKHPLSCYISYDSYGLFYYYFVFKFIGKLWLEIRVFYEYYWSALWFKRLSDYYLFKIWYFSTDLKQ